MVHQFGFGFGMGCIANCQPSNAAIHIYTTLYDIQKKMNTIVYLKFVCVYVKYCVRERVCECLHVHVECVSVYVNVERDIQTCKG